MISNLYEQEDKVVEQWETNFNNLMDMTEPSGAELFYFTEVRYEYILAN